MTTMAPSGPKTPHPRPGTQQHARWHTPAVIAGNLLAAAAFAWPFLATAVPAEAQRAVPYLAVALTPALAVAVGLLLDRHVASAKSIALLGVLGAIGAATRVFGDVAGGIEPVFIVLILTGRALGARFGFLLGLVTIAVSAALTGGVGPWLPFQLFACAWVGAGAGLLPRIRSRLGEIAMLAAYGALASWAIGALLNLWFWPFAIGGGSSIAYDPHASVAHKLSAFALYSLATSTLTWDTVRAITTVVGITLIGRPVLAALRRAKVHPPNPLRR